MEKLHLSRKLPARNLKNLVFGGLSMRQFTFATRIVARFAILRFNNEIIFTEIKFLRKFLIFPCSYGVVVVR